MRLAASRLPLPPGPVRLKVYVVESAGVTDVEPSACWVPRLGLRIRLEVSSEVQFSMADCPIEIVAGSAVSVHEGGPGGAGASASEGAAGTFGAATLV